MQEQGQRQGRTRGMTAHARFMCDVVHDWARARGDWRAGGIVYCNTMRGGRQRWRVSLLSVPVDFVDLVAGLAIVYRVS